MDEAHKELVKRLRDDHFGWVPEYAKQAATALEALASEVERLTSDVDALGENLEKVIAERDRLKAALVPFAKLETWRGAHDPGEGTMRMRVVRVPEIEVARKALEDAAGDGR